ncbi:MAG: PAS domain-containing protein, partial [Pseudomonadota bacterium]
MTESDRTQQLLLEENLRESERRFRIMAESIQCGLTIIESEKVVYLNKRAGEIVGYPLEELRHMNTSDITLPEDYHIIQDAFKIYRETGILPQELEFRIVRKDGSVRFVHNQYSVSHKDGKVLGRYIVTTDITDRKRGEEERAKLSSAIEQTEEIVIIMNARGQIEYGNPALEKITGYGPEELKSKNPFFPDTTVPDKQLYEQIWIAVSRGNVWKGHITYRKKDGAACELEQTTKPVRDAAGAIIGFISIIRDVTEKLTKLEDTNQQVLLHLWFQCLQL